MDPPADEGMDTRIVSSAYFEPLRVALADLLEELKRLSLEGKLQVEEPRPLRFNNRQIEYDKSREHTTKIDPSTIYCVQDAAAVPSATRSAVPSQQLAVHLVDSKRYWRQKRVQALRMTTSTTTPPTRRIKLEGPHDNTGLGFSLGAALSSWMP